MNRDELRAEILRLLPGATPPPWKLWANSVLYDQLGNSNVDDATPVADFHARRTFDADLVCLLRNNVAEIVDALGGPR